MKTGVIYARYSSDSQTEQSIEGQLRVCNEYAKNNDILILRTYIDRAMTGTNDNRPNFRQMIEDSKKHDFSIVLVYKFDRFSRNKYETTKHKKTLKDNGVKVVSATEYIPDSPEGLFVCLWQDSLTHSFLTSRTFRGIKNYLMNNETSILLSVNAIL